MRYLETKKDLEQSQSSKDIGIDQEHLAEADIALQGGENSAKNNWPRFARRKNFG